MACERLVAPSLRRILRRRAGPRDVKPSGPRRALLVPLTSGRVASLGVAPACPLWSPRARPVTRDVTVLGMSTTNSRRPAIPASQAASGLDTTSHPTNGTAAQAS
jgi:hypothetical protein